MEDRALLAEAFVARERAYAPYSNYLVGAALLAASGRVYRGCNVESASYSPTNCAERTAFFKAISDGERQFKAIAVVGAHRDDVPEQYGWFYPCGVCRQVMLEFCDPDHFRILVGRSAEEWRAHLLRDLLPFAFAPSAVTQARHMPHIQGGEPHAHG